MKQIEISQRSPETRRHFFLWKIGTSLSSATVIKVLKVGDNCGI